MLGLQRGGKFKGRRLRPAETCEGMLIPIEIHLTAQCARPTLREKCMKTLVFTPLALLWLCFIARDSSRA